METDVTSMYETQWLFEPVLPFGSKMPSVHDVHAYMELLCPSHNRKIFSILCRGYFTSIGSISLAIGNQGLRTAKVSGTCLELKSSGFE